MKVAIYVGEEKKVVDLFEVTYECQPERFKSLRLSKGSFPNNVDLDYKDNIVIFKRDFLNNPEEDFQTLFEYMESIPNEINQDGDKVIKENWFCFNKGTCFKDIVFFVQSLNRTIRH